MLVIPSLVLSTGISSAILKTVIDRTLEFVDQKSALFSEVDDNFSKLKRTLMIIQKSVDVLEKNDSVITEALGDLLQQLQNKFLDAEDLLDKIELGLQRSSSSKVKVNGWSQVHDFVPFYSSIPSEINTMQLGLDKLLTEMREYPTPDVSQSSSVPNLTSLIDESCVFGRDKDKSEMKKLVLSVEEVTNVSVIFIAGMGGIGKTTLAQLVYKDADVCKKFDLRMWVSVSSDNGLDIIAKSILESANGGWDSHLSSLESVQVELEKKLKGKRFLLVLDGIRNANLSYWDQFKLSLGAAKKGSKIMMTTRGDISASIVASTLYRLDPLCDKACWEIIKLTGNLDGQTSSEASGLAISKKCKGLPWVAKVIGSSIHLGEMKWDDLLSCEIWELQVHKTQICRGLKFYYDMPAYLKRCFSYCSVFPRDHVIEKDDLVQLWAAEGFIQGTEKIEDVGRQYFEDLHSRSFFSQVTGVSGCDLLKYKMHELIHDLARIFSTNLCFSIEEDVPCSMPISPNARYASVLYKKLQPPLQAFYKCKKLRTLAFRPKVPRYHSNFREVPYELFERLGCLRVLNLSHSAISKLPESIGNLIHLRYLNLSDTDIELLPKPLTTICGLETLKLNSCPKLLHLPEQLKDLIKLRHLEFDRHLQLSSMPRNIGKLTSLETLHAFKVGTEKGYHIEELKDMAFLRGSISITSLENVADSDQAEAAMLHNKQYLDRLELEWNEIRCHMQVMQPVQYEVLTGLKPHSGLKKLRVVCYYGSVFPKWIESSAFSKLESIKLEHCAFCVLLPALGQLPTLKELSVQNMSTLEVVDHLFCGPSSAAFQSLVTLTLCDMPELCSWSGLREKDMPCLEVLKVDSCPKLTVLPTFQYLESLECLDISRCPQLKSLPEGGLPPSLETLIISESDILKDRCKEGEGADWHKIRLIPKKYIDGERILAQRLDNQVDEIMDAPENISGIKNILLVCSVILFPLVVLIMRSMYRYLSQARD